MVIRSRSEVVTVLRQFTHGEISCGELNRYMLGQRVSLFDELLQRIKLRGTDYSAISLTQKALARRLGAFLEGEIPFLEFQRWICLMYQLHVHGNYRVSDTYCSTVECSLMLLALCMDSAISETPRASRSLASRIHGSLLEGTPLTPGDVLKDLYSGKRIVQFVTESSEADDEPWRAPQWVRLALLNPGYFDRSCSDHPENSNLAEGGGGEKQSYWFIPLTVCTREFWLLDRPRGAWVHPENDKVLSLVDRPLADRQPRLQKIVGDLSPRFYVDPYGLSEIVLEAPSIETKQLLASVQLFCSWNGVSVCYVDGRRSHPISEEI